MGKNVFLKSSNLFDDSHKHALQWNKSLNRGFLQSNVLHWCHSHENVCSSNERLKQCTRNGLPFCDRYTLVYLQTDDI